MRVLFDHNVPQKLRQSLTGHYIQTADEMKWSAIENGELLKVAENAGFDVMVTCDQNIVYQQNLKGRKLALVVLSTNYWPTIKLNTQPVTIAISASRSGSFQIVKF